MLNPITSLDSCFLMTVSPHVDQLTDAWNTRMQLESKHSGQLQDTSRMNYTKKANDHIRTGSAVHGVCEETDGSWQYS